MIVHGDYGEVVIEAGSVQLIVTSPPYPGQRGCGLDVAEWLGWIRPLLFKMYGELAHTGVLALNVQFRRREGWYDGRLFYELLTLLEREVGFYLVDVYAWDKLNPPPVGNFRGKRFRYDIVSWEPVFLLAKSMDYAFYPVRRRYQPKSLVKLKAGNRARGGGVNGHYGGGHSRAHPMGALPHNVLRMSPSGEARRPRALGGSFPLALPQRFILQHTRPGERVLDPFCGVGTTCVAAVGLGRQGMGVEIDGEEVERARAWVTAVGTATN